MLEQHHPVTRLAIFEKIGGGHNMLRLYPAGHLRNVSLPSCTSFAVSCWAHEPQVSKPHMRSNLRKLTMFWQCSLPIIPAKQVLSCQSLPPTEITAAASISGVPGARLSFEGLRLAGPGGVEPCLGESVSAGGPDGITCRQVQQLLMSLPGGHSMSYLFVTDTTSCSFLSDTPTAETVRLSVCSQG